MAHANARLTPRGRRLLVERIMSGWTITQAARAAAAHRQPRAHPAELVARLCARRRDQRVGPHVLAWESGLARSTVYALLRREGLARLDRLEPRAAVVRHERERPG